MTMCHIISSQNNLQIFQYEENTEIYRQGESIFFEKCVYSFSTEKYILGILVRVFVNDPGHRGSIPGWVIPKTQKMVPDESLLNSQHYKVWIKGKWRNH